MIKIEKKDYNRIINTIDFLIIFLIFILISVSISFYFINSDGFSDNKNNGNDESNDLDFMKNISISYDNLNKSEIIIVKSWLKDMKKEYLVLIKNLTFTKNQNIYNPEREFNYVGRNFNNEKIYILYTGDYEANKQTLCHEILHIIISGEKDIEEWFVDDIELYGVCYKYEE